MNEYLHHVPGRMRIRARLFLSESRERSQALRRLRAIPGIRSLRLNEKAGSVTLYYDTGIVSGEALLDTLRRECPQATLPTAAPGGQRPLRAASPRPIAAEIGKMALGVLVNKGVSFSLASLLKARI
ncbi:hypothetical protein TVNIR_0587 [Thioalkalivibrio nitratireducens DSM 14787]|uniref:Uncharacterized protein n=1 Tax=Thioalkalivibrio nitratireducens (strain DSM 14787 / UNIQEM 213 / ALEN2) TaxID=1255043 RepID=L0DTE9_THIND|nr:hypothetical protein [Thioalkalivibrio nitratireducens]AGA32288.1 hypothetical protein TVNIR_0587 [Thioalkalivibrio nitratireducens DSM 14787]